MGRVITAKDFEAVDKPVLVELTDDVKVRGLSLKAGDKVEVSKFEANTLLGLKRAKLADPALGKPISASR